MKTNETGNEWATLEELHEMLTSQLNDFQSGQVLCGIRSISRPPNETANPRFIIASALRSAGVAVSPGDLVEMPRTKAERLAEEMFRGPLGGPASRTESDARAAASSFLSRFEDGARFFSTWEYKVDGTTRNLTYTGKPALDSSMELSVFVVDSKHIGCLLVGDED